VSFHIIFPSFTIGLAAWLTVLESFHLMTGKPVYRRLFEFYYNGARTHLSLNKDAPISRAAENAGRIICRPILGGLHHQYGRM
jgi:hypothetical protein